MGTSQSDWDITLETECVVCAVKYNSAVWPFEVQGKRVCVGCTRRALPVVHYMRFTEYIASRPCERVYMWAHLPGVVTAIEVDAVWPNPYNPDTYCKLDCECVPCMARRVISQHNKFKRARKSTRD